MNGCGDWYLLAILRFQQEYIKFFSIKKKCQSGMSVKIRNCGMYKRDSVPADIRGGCRLAGDRSVNKPNYSYSS